MITELELGSIRHAVLGIQLPAPLVASLQARSSHIYGRAALPLGAPESEPLPVLTDRGR